MRFSGPIRGSGRYDRLVARRPVKRLGIYVDGPYSVVETETGRRVAPDPADFPFLSFACAVGSRFESTRLFGRARRVTDPEGRQLLDAAVEIEELPHYEDLTHLRGVAGATAGTARGFWRGLGEVDAVWIFGPHPFSLVLAGLAALRRKRIVLGVRQDTLEYFRGRLPDGRWTPALAAAGVLDRSFRVLARLTRATVVGDELARKYGGESPKVLPLTVSLIRDAQVVEAVRAKDWSGQIGLLTVGRIDQEKNPLLLVDAFAELERQRPGRYRLTWAGAGPLLEDVRRRAAELGSEGSVELLGFTPFGDGLLERYRDAHLFVHVSLTEGVPAVLAEAAASGTSIVATAVGGVPAALENGRAGLLVPPADRDALVGAILRLSDDSRLREGLATRALELARGWTLDAQTQRAAGFIEGRSA